MGTEKWVDVCGILSCHLGRGRRHEDVILDGFLLVRLEQEVRQSSPPQLAHLGQLHQAVGELLVVQHVHRVVGLSGEHIFNA